jgi:hypothetical protein
VSSVSTAKLENARSPRSTASSLGFKRVRKCTRCLFAMPNVKWTTSLPAKLDAGNAQDPRCGTRRTAECSFEGFPFLETSRTLRNVGLAVWLFSAVGRKRRRLVRPNVRAELPAEACVVWPRRENEP